MCHCLHATDRSGSSSHTIAAAAIRVSRTAICGSPSISASEQPWQSNLSRRVQRDSLRRVIEGQELERRRLARELHDETGQALASVLLGLKTVESAEDVPAALGKLRELVVATLQDVRRLAVELRPKALDDFGLVAALERLVETFRAATGISSSSVAARRAALAARGGDDALPHRAGGVDAVARHAGASRVSVLLVRLPDP